LEDIEFELKETDQAGNIVAVKYHGCWLMVDNGYLNWPVTMPPFKTSSNRDEVRWSQWLESMRKDVECTFGILKGRWRILKSGIRLHGVDSADKVWLTCCALHNMLIDIDGLDKGWKEGARSDWDGELGNLTNSEAAAILRMQGWDHVAKAKQAHTVLITECFGYKQLLLFNRRFGYRTTC
jgi:hypothetical protein